MPFIHKWWIPVEGVVSTGSVDVAFSNTAGYTDVNTGLLHVDHAYATFDYAISRDVTITIRKNIPNEGYIRLYGKNWTDTQQITLTTYWLATGR